MQSRETLQERRTAATRNHILDAAFDLLTLNPEQPLSHESVAARAGAGARTVYRYFPSQAELFQALWERLRQEIPPSFPLHESEIVGLAPKVFERFDRNEQVIRALLSSAAGTQVRDRGGPEGRAAFAKSLERLTSGMDANTRKRIVAVFVAIYSAPFWQLLRDRGGLSGPEAQAAVTWAMEALLANTRKKKGR